MRMIGLLGLVLLTACVTTGPQRATVPVQPVEEPMEKEELSKSEPVLVRGTESQSTLEEAIVVRVSDGDTVLVEFDEHGDGTIDRVKVRFIGVSTPEIGKPYSEMASVYLESLVLGKTVFMEREGLEEQAASGHYPRRLLRHIYVDDPATGERIHVNAAIVAAGYATSMPHRNERYRRKFDELEQEARVAKRGRWSPKPRKTAVRRHRRTAFHIAKGMVL